MTLEDNNTKKHDMDPYAPIPEYIVNESVPTALDGNASAKNEFEQQAREMNMQSCKSQSRGLFMFIIGALFGILGFWIAMSVYLGATGQVIGHIGESGIEPASGGYANISLVDGIINAMDEARNDSEEIVESRGIKKPVPINDFEDVTEESVE